MTCKELVELVTDYLSDALDGETRSRFEAHLSLCRGCAAYLEQMRVTVALARQLHEHDLTPPIRDELLALFREWKRHE